MTGGLSGESSLAAELGGAQTRLGAALHVGARLELPGACPVSSELSALLALPCPLPSGSERAADDER